MSEIKANDLIKGTTYTIDGKHYIFDGFSTFWNLRMISKHEDKLHIFKRGDTKVYPE